MTQLCTAAKLQALGLRCCCPVGALVYFECVPFGSAARPSACWLLCCFLPCCTTCCNAIYLLFRTFLWAHSLLVGGR